MNQDLIVCIQDIICLKKVKDGVYIINLDEYADTEYVRIGLPYFVTEVKLFIDNFGAEHVPEEIKEFIRKKNIKAKIF